MQKIYGGLVSNPVNKMDTFNGVALTRTYTGIVIDGSGPIADEKDIKFSPALPWAAGTRGTITLREPVTKDDLLNGALTFIDGNGMLYQPTDNDGYVDYTDTEENVLFSIAIGDEEETNTLTFTAPQEDNIQHAVLSAPVGYVEGISVLNTEQQLIEIGETGYLMSLSETNDGETSTNSWLTQDGVHILTAKRIADVNESRVFELLSKSTPFTINSALRLQSAELPAEFRALKPLKVDLFSHNNDAVIRVLHAPADDFADGATGRYLVTDQVEHLYCGDQVTKICIA